MSIRRRLLTLKRLGRRGLWNRLAVGWSDLSDWWQGRGRGGGRLPLQPWRIARQLPPDAEVTVLRPARPRLPLVHVDIYDRPGGEHRRLPKDMGRPTRRLHHLRDAVVLPRGVVFDRRSWTIVPIRYYAPKIHRWPTLRREFGDAWLRTPAARATSIELDMPVFPSEAGYLNFGHVLLEAVPRLLYLERCPPDTHVLTSLAMGETYLRLFEAMGVPRERVIVTKSPAYCREVYLADTPIDVFGSLDEDAFVAFDRVRRALAPLARGPMAERIYVSRRRFPGRRALENEAEVEELFDRYGFAIVYPEQLAAEEQVGLFANASMIAGPRGSAMHQVVYASADARVLMLSPRNMTMRVDSYLMRREGVGAHVLGDPLVAEGATRYTNRWTIDLALLEQAMRAHFRL